MPTVTNAVMKVDTTLPAGQRYIYLKETDMDGGTGEGDFVNGNGPDYIDVENTLKRVGSTVEIYLLEGTGGVGDAYTITLRVNPVKTMYLNSGDRERSVIPLPVDHLDHSITVDTNVTAIEITSREGEPVSWFNSFAAIYNIEIDGIVTASGTVGEFNILIK